MLSYEPLPQKQLLSYQVRGPEIEAIISVFQQQPLLSLEALVTKFVPPEPSNQSAKTELLREALNFLRSVEFIHQVSDETQTVTFHLDDNYSAQEPFVLQLLRRLQSFEDDRRTFRLIIDLVTNDNILLAHRKEIITKLEQVYPGSYSWNEEKYRTWQNIADYLGLVRSIKPEQGDTMFCPQPELLHKLIQAYQASHGKAPQVPMGSWLDFVHETYFSCFTKRKDVHIGVARSLKAMHTMGQLTLDMRSDTPGAIHLEGQRVAYLLLS